MVPVYMHDAGSGRATATPGTTAGAPTARSSCHHGAGATGMNCSGLPASPATVAPRTTIPPAAFPPRWRPTGPPGRTSPHWPRTTGRDRASPHCEGAGASSTARRCGPCGPARRDSRRQPARTQRGPRPWRRPRRPPRPRAGSPTPRPRTAGIERLTVEVDQSDLEPFGDVTDRPDLRRRPGVPLSTNRSRKGEPTCHLQLAARQWDQCAEIVHLRPGIRSPGWLNTSTSRNTLQSSGRPG